MPVDRRAPAGAERMQKALSWFTNTHWVVASLVVLFLSYGVVVLLDALAPQSFSASRASSGSPLFLSSGLLGKLIIGSVVAPLLETAFTQWAPIQLVRYILKWNPNLAALVSACTFGGLHYYSLDYVIWTFLVGLVFAYAYVLRGEHGGHPFAVVFTAHSLRNLIASVVVTLWPNVV